MASSIADFIREIPPSDYRQLLLEVAKRILADQPLETPIVLSEGDSPPIGFLFKIPPIPESLESEEAERAEDERRLATIDNTLTLEEMLAKMDFRAAVRNA